MSSAGHRFAPPSAATAAPRTRAEHRPYPKARRAPARRPPDPFTRRLAPAPGMTVVPARARTARLSGTAEAAAARLKAGHQHHLAPGSNNCSAQRSRHNARATVGEHRARAASRTRQPLGCRREHYAHRSLPAWPQLPGLGSEDTVPLVSARVGPRPSSRLRDFFRVLPSTDQQLISLLGRPRFARRGAVPAAPDQRGKAGAGRDSAR